MEEQEPSYTPASFEKRVAAWIGIGYMLMLIALNTYTIATARTLPGTAPLLVVPVGIGVPFIAVHRQRHVFGPFSDYKYLVSLFHRLDDGPLLQEIYNLSVPEVQSLGQVFGDIYFLHLHTTVSLSSSSIYDSISSLFPFFIYLI